MHIWSHIRKILDFVVNKKGIEIDPDKVRVIQDLPPSHTQKEVKSFMGRLNYIARFISQITTTNLAICDAYINVTKYYFFVTKHY